ncbi:outer membrane protein assembly factor BamD [Arcobacter sp. F2176]|uniref:outer membrane protein assembly factor BamD n=1 Tax=Arcobacter sp. F2176 TaxID=2044511 RepID=UPI00100AD363|nr:outer membrane protein assembly factor BamD [Arcobacter sp. F2176]RXJ81794.1 outer membrane protein assembly factor BamD [Arcobacter sp. F2176]
MIGLSTIAKKSLSLVIIAGFAMTLISCSSKKGPKEYGQPAIYWYNKITDDIATSDLESADDAYISLESEHKNSPLLATALEILVNAHIEEEEYALANFYIDEYTKRFGVSKSIDYFRYLKIKANFLSFSSEFREQNLITETQREINEFIIKFPNSPYMPLVGTINARLAMAKASFDKEIADLYTRIDKPKAAKFYEEKVSKNWVDPKEIKEVNVPWYRAIFE